VLVVQWKFGRREGGILRGGGCGALHGYKGGRVASLTCIPDSRRGGGCEVWLRLPLGHASCAALRRRWSCGEFLVCCLVVGHSDHRWVR
jgi:hypothetical protein